MGRSYFNQVVCHYFIYIFGRVMVLNSPIHIILIVLCVCVLLSRNFLHSLCN